MLSEVMTRVERYWITEALDSLSRIAWITVGLSWTKDQVDTPAKILHITPQHGIKELDCEERVAEVFSGCGRRLLVLGAPGGGKTTTLLKLARVLLERAKTDPTQPVPIVVPLYSWTGKHGRFQDWLLGTIEQWYDVKPGISLKWLSERRTILLLDGLDEIAVNKREDFVRCCNDFINEVGLGLPGLAVTCRYEEYAEIPTKLMLQEAITLTQLRPEQTDNYLEAAGPKLEPLRQALLRDPVLSEISSTPFMLGVLIFTYSSLDPAGLARSGAIEERRKQIFSDYIDAAFRRPVKRSSTRPQEQTVAFLAYLARQMKLCQTKFFSLENLQPLWLSSGTLQFCYLLLTRMTGGLLVGLAIFLLPGWSFGWEPLTIAACAGICLGTADFVLMRWIPRRLRKPAIRVCALLLAGIGAAALSYWVWLALSPHGFAWRFYLESGITTIKGVYLLLMLWFCFVATKQVATEDVRPFKGLHWSWSLAWRRTLFVASFAPWCSCFILIDDFDLSSLFGDSVWWPLVGAFAGGGIAIFIMRRWKRKITAAEVFKVLNLSFVGAILIPVIVSAVSDYGGFDLDDSDSVISALVFAAYVLVFVPPFAGLTSKQLDPQSDRITSLWFWFKGPLQAAMYAAVVPLIISGAVLLALWYPNRRTDHQSPNTVSTTQRDPGSLPSSPVTNLAAVLQMPEIRELQAAVLNTNASPEGIGDGNRYAPTDSIFYRRGGTKWEIKAILTNLKSMSDAEAVRWARQVPRINAANSLRISSRILALTYAIATLVFEFAVVAFLRFGGLNAIAHYLLRFLMVRSGRLPPNPKAFLEEATQLILMRRRGSAYEFLHATFHEYMATIPTTNGPRGVPPTDARTGDAAGSTVRAPSSNSSIPSMVQKVSIPDAVGSI